MIYRVVPIIREDVEVKGTDAGPAYVSWHRVRMIGRHPTISYNRLIADGFQTA